jgi:hypothetical protein
LRTFRKEIEFEFFNRLRQGDEIEEVVVSIKELGRHLYEGRRQPGARQMAKHS